MEEKEDKRLLSDLYNNKKKNNTEIKGWIQRKHKFVLSLIGGVIIITTLIINIDNVKSIWEKYSPNTESFFKDPTSYKILLLPFGSSQNCTEENILCERELQNRFQRISEKDSLLNIEVNVLNGVNNKNQATSFERAKELGDSVGANLVIWGDYQSKCEWDSTKIRIRYAIIKDPPYFLKSEKMEDYESISDVTQIEQGVLTGTVEDLIYTILALKAWNIEKNIKKTIYYLNKVDVKTKIEYVEIYAMLGTAYMLAAMKKGGDFIDSSDFYFLKAIEVNPNESGIYFNRGVLNKSIGCYQEALNDFNRFIELDTTNNLIYQYRGDTYLALKKPEKALMDYEKSIKIDSLNSDVYELIGNLYQEQNEFRKALKNYNKSIILNPKNATALGNRAGIHFKTKYYTLALNDLNEAIKWDSVNPYIYFNKGNVFLDQQKFDLALAEYNKAIKIDSSFSPAYQNRSFIYYTTGDVLKYQSDLKKLNALKTKQ